MKSLSHVLLFVTPWTVAYLVPPSMEVSRQEYWSGLPFPSPGDLPTQRLNLHCRQMLTPSEIKVKLHTIGGTSEDFPNSRLTSHEH